MPAPLNRAIKLFETLNIYERPEQRLGVIVLALIASAFDAYVYKVASKPEFRYDSSAGGLELRYQEGNMCATIVVNSWNGVWGFHFYRSLGNLTHSSQYGLDKSIRTTLTSVNKIVEGLAELPWETT